MSGSGRLSVLKVIPRIRGKSNDLTEIRKSFEAKWNKPGKRIDADPATKELFDRVNRRFIESKRVRVGSGEPGSVEGRTGDSFQRDLN
jgi:hypothetical protein